MGGTVMSLVPTWVLCDDRRMYRDAVLAAAADGDWFICFDDNDPPELVMQGGSVPSRRLWPC